VFSRATALQECQPASQADPASQRGASERGEEKKSRSPIAASRVTVQCHSPLKRPPTNEGLSALVLLSAAGSLSPHL